MGEKKNGKANIVSDLFDILLYFSLMYFSKDFPRRFCSSLKVFLLFLFDLFIIFYNLLQHIILIISNYLFLSFQALSIV